MTRFSTNKWNRFSRPVYFYSCCHGNGTYVSLTIKKPKLVLLTSLLPFLVTVRSRVLEKKVNETQVSKTVFSHLNIIKKFCMHMLEQCGILTHLQSNFIHGQKQLRQSPKKTCFVECLRFSISNFHISTPSPLFNVVTTWQCPQSVFQHWKGGERGLAIHKKRCFFFNYGRTLLESVCFAQMCQHFCLSL